MLQQQVELTPFQVMTAAEGAPLISTRLPTDPPPGPNFEELGPGDDPLDTGGISGGNRWPRQETLALLKIRSDMDAAFRDATLKGPLWDEVSRKLGELGYKRSSKKCKEKFENVHKYYKRTKEGRTGRQDGKSYRFFDQLEALHNITMSQNPSPRALLPAQISAPTPISTAAPGLPPPPPSSGPELSFSTNTSSSSEYDSDRGRDGTEGRGKKRKRKMMEFFEGMMRQVIERQEAMHQRFLEAIEKREQDRMIREEARQRQEMLRIAHERELAAQERAAAASRDAAIVSFLQKFTGQTVQLQAPPPPPSPPHTVNEKQQQQQQQQQNEHQITPPPPQPPPASSELVPREKSSEPHDPMSSRWPKSEVHALIQLRSELDSRYHETGPKGPLWEEISAGMQKLGYNRSAKRCKEKWENINKYFKKVKESDKKRPNDAKTCPYFHQLDALYRSKHNNNGGSGSTISALDQTHSNLNPNPSPITMIAPSENQGEMENKSCNDGNIARGDNSGMIMKKPEDIMKELMGKSNNDYGEHDSDNMDEYDEDDEEDDNEDGNGQYRIQFQKQNVSNNGSGSGTTPNNGSGKVSGSFLAVVR